MSSWRRTGDTAARLSEAMAAAELNQPELAKRAGLNKSTISRYLSGTVEPKQKAVHKLAIALNVSEMWLWGYDVSKERTTEQEPEELADIAAAVLLDADLMALVEDYMKLKKDSNKFAARLAVSSLVIAEQSEQKKTDPKVSQEVQTVSLSEIE